ncbi:MAG: NAD-dependent epimerase/dehydratase family protein [Candidatus Saccharicenans sp.]|nr:NAD-dependent epimerase/dehydratase family protein [Candidatus Saccharicenans sp.]
MITAITGGSGFIGRRLVESLLRDGEKVRLLLRNPESSKQAEDFPLEPVKADILRRDELRPALEGCDKLYHLAAYARNWAPDSQTFYRVNVEGFKNILEVSLAAGVKRLVFVSSAVVSGPSENQPVVEETRREHLPFLTDYEASKALAEKLVPEYINRGLEIVVARPTRVFGPGLLTEANSVTRLIKYYLRYRLCPVLGDGSQLGNYVFVDDVVNGLKLLMSRGQSGETYFLGGENVSLSGFYDLLEETTGRKAVRLKISPAAAFALARLESWKARFFGIYPLITEGWVKTFLLNWAVSIDKARRELGYSPRSLKEGLMLTCRWLGFSLRR